jgi:hypothetical protein
MLAALRSPLRPLLMKSTTALRYPARDGHQVTLPVGYVREGSDVVVLVGRSSAKRWWRHFRARRPVELWWHGKWQLTTARALTAGSREHAEAVAAYATAHRRAQNSENPVVLVGIPVERESDLPARGPMWRAWTGWVTLGEFVGFGFPAVTGALIGDVAGFSAAALLVTAGAVEGGVLGAAQSHVLVRAVPLLRRRQWILATAAAAALAWAIGLIPMLTNGFQDLPAAVWAPMTIVLGVILIGSIGTAQWLVLRPYVDNSSRWILATAGAWVAGLAVFTAVTTPLWQPGQPAVLLAAIGALGGLLMACTVAALTGWAFVRICLPLVRSAGDGQATNRDAA